jgi:hypothetical protein
MNKRALVVGSEVHGLSGVANDCREMQAALAQRGFEVELRLDERATRAGILEGLRVLIAQSQPGDVALFYYAGHGQYTPSSDRADPRRYQGIVPTDWSQTTADDFRGISSWELSCNLARLTARTRNAVLILDCCHATLMCRDGISRQATVRALPDPLATNFTAHIKALRALYPELDEVTQPGWSNPELVRLVASGRTESAHELPNAQGICRGVFSEALVELLREAEDGSITWATLGHAVRERVLRGFPSQRPDLEGPLHRRLFTLVEEDSHGGVPIVPLRAAKHGHYLLQAGRLTGVSVGDVYSVMPMSATALEPAKEIARVVVVSTAATTSEARVKDWSHHHTAMPDDAVALPRERKAPRRAVTVIAPPHGRGELEKALAMTSQLRTARAEEAERSLATLRLEGEQLTIEDARGPLFPAVRYPQGLPATLDQLADLGVAEGLRELQSEGLSERQLTIEIGVVHEGEAVRLADRGAELGLNDRLYVYLRNKSQRRLYAHVFSLGVRSEVRLLSNFAPSGILLEGRHDAYVLGENEATGELEGLDILWPEGLPATGEPRLDEIIVIVTTRPASLRALESRPPQQRSAGRRAAGTQLQEMLAQLQDGQSRDVGAAESDPFLIKRMSYFLDPRPISLAAAAATAGAAKAAIEVAIDAPAERRGVVTRSA